MTPREKRVRTIKSDVTDMQFRRVLRVLDELKDLTPSCTINTAIAFLTIALDEGVTVGAVQRALGLEPISTARSVAVLYKKVRGKPGLGLVDSMPHDTDARIKLLVLTPKGEKLWEKLRAIMENNYLAVL